MSRVVISGGGTGGHIYPAIEIAQALLELEPAAEIYFIGGANRLESTIVPNHGFRFLPISVAGLPRKLTWKWFPVIGKVCGGVAQSLQFIRKLKPRVVIGTGGYVSGPVLFAAARLGIPTVIQEQNACPGLTNRLLSRWAKAAYLAFDTSPTCFPSDIVKVTGNPIRPAIASFARSSAIYEKLRLDPSLKTIFIMGGSQGAHAINQVVTDALPHLAPYHQQLQLIHQTGKTDYKRVREKYDRSPLKHFIQPYFDPIEEVYSMADLMVCRAGGMTVSEITACGLPAIFIPLPSMAGNNQELNAQAIAKTGAGIVLNQRTLTSTLLANQISNITGNPAKQQQMAEASQQLGKPRASEEIANSILSFMRKN